MLDSVTIGDLSFPSLASTLEICFGEKMGLSDFALLLQVLLKVDESLTLSFKVICELI